jgi:hypothetical protein
MAARAGSDAEARETPLRINMSWLVRLRWGAIFGQLVTIGVVHAAMGIQLPLTPLLGLVALEALTNVAALAWLRSGRPIHEATLPLTLATDVGRRRKDILKWVTQRRPVRDLLPDRMSEGMRIRSRRLPVIAGRRLRRPQCGPPVPWIVRFGR